MRSFLERYKQGEHTVVWDELLALGEAVREEPLYDDALSVARETMRRVRSNIELLIPRLRTAGYDFGYAWLEAITEWEIQHHTPLTPEDFRQMKKMGVSDELLQEMAEHDGDELTSNLDYARQPHPILSPPGPDVHAQLAALERLVGPIPLSLYAWYEQVGAVDFIGSAPAKWGQVPVLLPPGSWQPYYVDREGRPEPDSAGQTASEPYRYSVLPLPLGREGVASAEDLVHISDATERHEADEEAHEEGQAQELRLHQIGHDLDPLFVYPLDDVIRIVTHGMRFTQTETETRYLDIAPDEYFKYEVSGGGPYAIRVPDARADALLEGEWHNTTFVNYLRICFRWAGLPGLESRFSSESTEVAFLTEGLLPV
jgi:hypothetical protein